MMLPSYVDVLPSGRERGDCYAIDLGGTNLRVGGWVVGGWQRCYRGAWLSVCACHLFALAPQHCTASVDPPQVAHVALSEADGAVEDTHIRCAVLLSSVVCSARQSKHAMLSPGQHPSAH